MASATLRIQGMCVDIIHCHMPFLDTEAAWVVLFIRAFLGIRRICSTNTRQKGWR